MSSDKEIKILAYLIADNIDIKGYKSSYPKNLHTATISDLFYKEGPEKYIYILNYGAVAFAGYSEQEITAIIGKLNAFCSNVIVTSKYKEDFNIQESEGSVVFHHGSLRVPKIFSNLVKIAMLNVCQSVALDYYTDESQNLLTETVKHTKKLEQFGTLSISKTKLLKFTGRALNLRNQIIDNLYILDAPDIVWNDESLEKINDGLSRTFDLKKRFQELDYTLKITESNLTTFVSLIQNKESFVMEVIIIGLILFEVVYMLLAKIDVV